MPLELPARITFLKQIQLFRGLSDQSLTTIAGKLDERSCEQNEVVVSQGQMAKNLYLVYSGKVSVSPNKDQAADQMTVLEPGGYFGEEALSPKFVYASTVIAQESSLLLVFPREYSNLLPAVSIPERIAFLSRVHLFHGLDEAQLETVAAELAEETFPANKEIIKQGDLGDRIYLIYAGKVRVTQKGKEKSLATFVAGDYFGEESIVVKNHRRTATVTSEKEVTALVLTRGDFLELLKQARGLLANFKVTVNSYRLARRIQFKWLQPDEVIYFLARKHPILLVRAITVPIFLEFIAILTMILAWWYSAWISGMVAVWWVAFIGSIIAAGWGVWNALDWGNDFYIVTNRRVVWLEKVIGIYDSRQEAPLSAVQRINVTTELTGRLLDYGNLVIRTIVGSTLTLKNVDHPNQAAALIEEHWKRSKESSNKLEVEEMRQALRERLIEGKSTVTRIPSIIKNQEKVDPYKGQRGFANLFRLRFENKAIVTYRKHIFVLFEQTWKPGLLILVLVGALIYEFVHPVFSFKNLLTNMTGPVLLLVWFLLFVVSFVWWLYQYVDWSNDIFQVTPDQIMDIDRTPLGEETSDIASLDNILSIEYERRGILELLFNYGHVFITVGGGKQMVFEDVFNPSAVQQDIERRRLEKIAKKEQEKNKADRDRSVSWFEAYYRGEPIIRSEEQAEAESSMEGIQEATPPADAVTPEDDEDEVK